MGRMDRLLVILGLTLGLSACGPAPYPAEEVGGRLQEPDNPLLLAEHLDVLLRPEIQGRVTGSRSFALAAQYVEDRMRAFRLQPALEGRYRIVYEARVHLTWPAVLGWADQDTAAFLPGLEFWPDARSDTGRVVADQVALCAQPRTCLAAPVWVLPTAVAAEAAVLAQTRSVRAVLLIGPLHPALADAPISGLRLLQITPEAAARLLALPVSTLQAHLADTTSVMLQLHRPIFLQVHRMGEAHVGALNVLGFVAGKDPVLRNELVIIGADLDVIALPGSSLLFDGAHLGEGVAALLELARLYSTLATYWPLPRRTLLFAVWSGARQGHQGLRAYLRQPLWDPDATRRIVYLDPEPKTLAELHQLAEQYGVALAPVLPPDSLQVDRRVFWRVPSDWLQAYRRIYNAPAAVSIPEPEALRTRASQRARALVREAQAILLPEAITPDPWAPVREDTLRLPVTGNAP